MNGKFDAMSNYRNLKADYESQARQFDGEWRSQRAAILNDRNLSSEGKRAQLAEIDVRRVAAVAKLQEQAAGFLDNHRTINARNLEAAAAVDLAKRRETLGDAVIVDLWARRLPKMGGRAVQDAYKEAVGWEKEIVRAYALAALEDRQNEHGDLTNADDLAAWQGLQAPIDAELAKLRDQGRELDAGARWVESLDLDGGRRDIAAKFGVSYEATLQAEPV